jgi:hypothetical protein
MAERNTFFNDESKSDSDNQFFGKAPKSLELAFIGVCLGAPIQYKKERTTGLDQVCMLVPNRNGFQPVMVTFGKEDSIGNGAYDAVCHQLNLEKLLNLTKRR